MVDNETEGLSVVDKVIAVLNTELSSNGQHNAPYRLFSGLDIAATFTDLARKDVSGAITLNASNESPYGDCWQTQYTYNVTLTDLEVLAQTAPQFRPCFAKVARDLIERLEDDTRADRKAIAGWCDRGLPTTDAMPVMKPLRWKFLPGVNP